MSNQGIRVSIFIVMLMLISNTAMLSLDESQHDSLEFANHTQFWSSSNSSYGDIFSEFGWSDGANLGLNISGSVEINQIISMNATHLLFVGKFSGSAFTISNGTSLSMC